ncbi:FHA domain-containing protein [Nocardioides sp.]|uniref:FHA domain-containing protein n=1 Tax=Nocardioides sp. TaxID=35761 RepID=UPI002B279050|nr:FHA domain-containing protein [Nocardioides sp.]
MRCSAGHETTATDYCDTCGLAIDATAQEAAVPAEVSVDVPDPAPAATTCPHCSIATPPNALFCENCGYDFTTGSLPRPVEPPAPAAASSSLDLNPSPAPDDAWVAEIWIDPDWYADQQSTDPLPSPGLPAVVALRHTSVLIGRSSRSRNIDPGLELDSDSGVSRRHAQLTTDGSRWFVEDLGSSNGTYVGGGLGTLPTTPIPVGVKTEIAGDDRLYLGAWTRIVLRKAEPGEVPT